MLFFQVFLYETKCLYNGRNVYCLKYFEHNFTLFRLNVYVYPWPPRFFTVTVWRFFFLQNRNEDCMPHQCTSADILVPHCTRSAPHYTDPLMPCNRSNWPRLVYLNLTCLKTLKTSIGHGNFVDRFDRPQTWLRLQQNVFCSQRQTIIWPSCIRTARDAPADETSAAWPSQCLMDLLMKNKRVWIRYHLEKVLLS